jgi:N6-L-threonylcarbamoyladenine synthase
MSVTILSIESSCDDTSAAVLRDREVLSNIIANQEVHRQYGGVVPELASRVHQQNIVPVVEMALRTAGVERRELDAVAFTRGPGLLGSLLVGTSFAKSFALALGVPIIEVDHLKAHILSHFIKSDDQPVSPRFPFICLTVSGGHTQIMRVDSPSDMSVLGKTIDDAAGEAFDKAAKIMGLPYPGGPHIDRLAKEGNPHAFPFPEPRIKGFDYSFSGLKTSFLYFLRDRLKENGNFIEENMADLSASIQHTIVKVLIKKLEKAAAAEGINQIALAGGVAANSGLREALQQKAAEKGWKLFLPPLRFTTDNAAMIAIVAYYKFLEKDFASQEIVPYTKSVF